MSDCKHLFQQQVIHWPDGTDDGYAWVCAICDEPGYEVPDEHPR